MKIALTGGLGAGKSTVCQLLEKKGATILSADAIVHDLLQNDLVVIEKVKAFLGESVVIDGKIDRALVAQIVFSDPKKLKVLEEILHPAVRKKIDRLSNDAKNHCVVEIPLLFEGDTASDYDATIAVVAPEKECQDRYERRYPDRTDYQKRVARQLTQQEKANRADFIVQNSGSLSDLEQQVASLWNALDKPNHNQL